MHCRLRCTAASLLAFHEGGEGGIREGVKYEAELALEVEHELLQSRETAEARITEALSSQEAAVETARTEIDRTQKQRAADIQQINPQ